MSIMNKAAIIPMVLHHELICFQNYDNQGNEIMYKSLLALYRKDDHRCIALLYNHSFLFVRAKRLW